MARTTDELVAGIIEVDEDIDLTPFIETAAELVTEVCEPEGYSESRLELIERWLSAHFYSIRDPRVVQEAAGPVQASYQNKVGLNLSNSHYGQQAMMLDTAGGLRVLSETKATKKLVPGVTWLGTETEVRDEL